MQVGELGLGSMKSFWKWCVVWAESNLTSEIENGWDIQAKKPQVPGEPTYEWANRHTLESWRERYKKNQELFDPIIALYARVRYISISQR